MDRSASVIWTNGLKNGIGKVSTESKVLFNTYFNFNSRFENEYYTNPEELIGAAHAACFSMALAGQLEYLGFSIEHIDVKASVSLERQGEFWEISNIHLSVLGHVGDIDEEGFKAAAEKTKVDCVVSRVLNAPITLDARLEGAYCILEKKAS